MGFIGIQMFNSHSVPLIQLLYCKFSSNSPPVNLLPEVLGCKNLIVVYELALVTGNLQRGKNIIHAREAGARTRHRAVHFPLENVKARPASHMRSLEDKVPSSDYQVS